jgi:3-oxoacyl-[acyl-carrier-protein] synthase-3
VPGSRIAALGHAQPAQVVTNADLSAIVDTTDEWIRSRVGIDERRIAADDETVTDLACQAAEKALAQGGRDPADLDLVVVATCTDGDRMPSVAARVSARLGVRTAPAFDVNAACAGFCYALATADHAVRAEAARNALVIGVDRMSGFLDWTDRTTCVIFGDGAGAAILTAADRHVVGPVVWGSVPERADVIRITADHPYIVQQGQTVFRWAITDLAPVAEEAARRAGIGLEDVHGFVAHQANGRIISAIAERAGLGQAVIARDVAESGNTSAGSVPLAFSKLVASGELPPDVPVLLLGFGAGLSYAAQVVWSPEPS